MHFNIWIIALFKGCLEKILLYYAVTNKKIVWFRWVVQNVVVYSKYYYLTLKRNRVKLQNIRGLIRKQTDNDASESEELCGIFFS